MALKYKITSEEFEALSADLKALYGESDGDYVLEVSGAVAADKLDEFRNNNRTLNKTLNDMKKKYGDIDLEKVNELLAREQELEEGKLLKSGDVESVIEARIKKALAPIQQENETLKVSNVQSQESLNKLLIDQNVVRLAAKFGAYETAIDDICSRARSSFKIVDGKAVAVDKDGDPMLSSSGDPVSMEDWVGTLKTVGAPHCFRTAQGGNESGSESSRGQKGEKTAHDKITSGLSKL